MCSLLGSGVVWIVDGSHFRECHTTSWKLVHHVMKSRICEYFSL